MRWKGSWHSQVPEDGGVAGPERPVGGARREPTHWSRGGAGRERPGGGQGDIHKREAGGILPVYLSATRSQWGEGKKRNCNRGQPSHTRAWELVLSACVWGLWGIRKIGSFKNWQYTWLNTCPFRSTSLNLSCLPRIEGVLLKRNFLLSYASLTVIFVAVLNHLEGPHQGTCYS